MTTWNNNAVQYPRLLAEVIATQVNLDLNVLAESMDLTREEVAELFDRAQDEWEAIKQGTRPTVEMLVTVNRDLVPGAFHTDESVVTTVYRTLVDRLGHYQPKVVLVHQDDDEEPDEWFPHSIHTDEMVPAEGGEPVPFARLMKHVETSQTPTTLHDHAPGEDCGECEHWYQDPNA